MINLRVPQDTQDDIPAPGDIGLNDVVTYEEAHRSTKPAAYIAFGFQGDEFNIYKQFTLGDGQKCCDRRRREITKAYYNGPLEPNTKYQAFTRAFTSDVSLNFFYLEIGLIPQDPVTLG